MRVDVRVRLQNRFLALLVVILLLLTIFHPFSGWLTLLIAFGGAFAIAYLWAKTLAVGLRLDRAQRFGWAQVGDRLEQRFSLSNDGFLPAIWVEIDYFSNLPGYSPARATGVEANNRSTWVTSGVCGRRGLFTLGPLVMRTGDPLGIFQVEIVYPSTLDVLVTPPVIPLDKFRISPGGRISEGRPRMRTWERHEDFSHLREFVHGDSFRRIHWLTTARKNDFYVRVMENNPAGDWWIFLDLESQYQVGPEDQNTEEHGVILAASLAELGLRTGKAVGLATQGRQFTWLPPGVGETQRQTIGSVLALACRGDISLATMLSYASARTSRYASLIIITTNPDPAWTGYLAAMAGSRIQPTVLLLDPDSYESNGRQGQSLSGVTQKLRELGIGHKLLLSDYFNRPEARPGKQGKWVWHPLESNRASAVYRPANLDWRSS
jgi:uncharacterized protein (DUF58 family)